VVEAEGLSRGAQAWQARDYGAFSFLWHRQLQAAFAGGEIRTAASQEPLDDAAALAAAKDAGAKVLLSGELEQGQIDKRGADEFLNTNFGGTNYTLRMKSKLRALDVASGKPVPVKDWSYSRVFFDPTRLGSPDYKTFPSFFVVGLKSAAEDFSGQKELRSLAGLPELTPTPTITPTPMTTPPTPGPSPTPAATFTPVPEPTPDFQPYWANPKTGKKVNPDWNFDPEDGTPRKDFVLRQPAPKPTPIRQLDQR
jgi:hypothetical protein